MTYLTALLKQYLIVLAERNAEDDRSDVLEAMNPLLPFASLAAYVKHATLTLALQLNVCHRVVELTVY